MTYGKTALALACAGTVSIFATGAFADGGGEIVTTPVTQLPWETTAEGVGFAPLEGDRFSEAYMAMVRLPAGLVSPAHVKSFNMFGVVVSGTITHMAMGADPATEIRLSEGAYYMVPAGLAHVSRCVSETDCVTFLVQDGRFDFLPVDQ